MDILVLTFLCGIAMGVLVGLFPVLPVWVGPLLLMPWIGNLDLVHILVFYMTVAVGSQFFGSVATLLTGIPGETSALSYSDYVGSLTRGQRLELINQTAWASMLTSIVITALVAVTFIFAGPWLSTLISFKIQWAVLALCAVIIIASSSNKTISFLLLTLGIILAVKTHPNVPNWAVSLQHYSQDLTVFLITVAAVIVPSILFSSEYTSRAISKIQLEHRQLKSSTVKDSALGGLVGFFVGFMPGPAAMLSSILAFRLPKSSIHQGIVRAESANNAAIITETVPFFGIGIPINTTAIIVFSIISLKLIDWPNGVYHAWQGWPVYAWVFASVVMASVIFFWLSTRFLKSYVDLLNVLGRRIHWLWIVLLSVMIVLDIMINAVGWLYPAWLVSMIMLGIMLWWFRVSGVALIFGYVLGDKLVWSFMQFVEYYL